MSVSVPGAGERGAPPKTALGRPLRIAVLVKQVPPAESFALGMNGRLSRAGLSHEMNPYCRRAVSKGVELAMASGGTCTVVTLGPPEAEDVLREAIAWGAGEGIHVCDPALAGSDTFATARALATALRLEEPFDLVLVGRNSIDGDTGQVGPEVAELVGLPFVSGVRRMEIEGNDLDLVLEHDDGSEEVGLSMPALLSVAERLCNPCKVDPEGRRQVRADRIRRISVDSLGAGPWGELGSPTRVGTVRVHEHRRLGVVLSGDLEIQVKSAVELLIARGALTPGAGVDSRGVSVASEIDDGRARVMRTGSRNEGPLPIVLVLLEAGRPQGGTELLGAAVRLANEVGGRVVAFRSPSTPEFAGDPEPAWTPTEARADEIIRLVLPDSTDQGLAVAEDVAVALIEWAERHAPWVVLAPSTAFGREVAGRAAAALSAGLVGDAIAMDVVNGTFVAAKPAFSGALIADITCTSPISMATIRPGVLPAAIPTISAGSKGAKVSTQELRPRGRIRVASRRRDDDVEVLARAEVVMGVGTGVEPHEYPALGPLSALLGAEMAATRKVTDRGWVPRSRQVGITGRSIAPRLYVALGLSGKFNHMVGVRSAGTILAVNADRHAPVFALADIGIVGDWHDVVPLLGQAVREARGGPPDR